MKVLVIGPDYFNYTSSVTWALNKLGHNAIEKTWVGFYGNCNYIAKKLSKLGISSFKRQYYRDWNEKLIDHCKSYNPDICFIINGEWIFDETMAMFKQKGIKLILYLIDSIIRLPENESKLYFYDRIFSFEPKDQDYIANKFSLTCSYLPVGYDPRFYYQDNSVKQDIDISFIGANTPNRLSLLREVANHAKNNGLKLAVYGHYWSDKYWWKKEKIVKKIDPLHLFIENRKIPPSIVGSVYRRSKICLNIHIPEHEGVNPRTFEILACGAFQLIDTRKDMKKFLNNNEHLVSYLNSRELIEKIEYYLNNYNERKVIASQGCNYVENNYSVISTIARIMEQV
ncbi:CgeB family protein [Sporomusa sp.]|uniref:CgeB family protein n=1 Tax=Sporomusa sp. TaxID=2078658 RepID=UPI002CB392FF|nr:glycosyltransferase [Sporomusa sp.]HWR44300.1 glycosyltransferase [Sporomusa sp.]